MVKTIIFDYDGTIHQTLGIYEPAFRETYQWLTEQKVAEEQKIASSKIAGMAWTEQQRNVGHFYAETGSEI